MTQPTEKRPLIEICLEIAQLGEIGEPATVINVVRLLEVYRDIWKLPSMDATIAHMLELSGEDIAVLCEPSRVLRRTMP